MAIGGFAYKIHISYILVPAYGQEFYASVPGA